jgi:glutamate carboxypeptidase
MTGGGLHGISLHAIDAGPSQPLPEVSVTATFLDCPIDAGAILADIERIARIESPTSHAEGVNRVLDAVAASFEGTGATLERRKIDARSGDLLRVRCDPGRSEPGILVLSHVDTVHPLGTLSGPLPVRRDGDRVYGPGVYDMKGGLVMAVAAFRALARAGVPRPLPLTFLFNPDEEVGSVASRRHIEAEGERHRYVLVTEPKRAGGKIVTQRKGTGRFVIRTRGRPAHAGAAHEKGRSAIRAMARIILEVEGFTDYRRGITTNVGLVSGGTGVNVVPEHCTINADLRVRDLAAAAEMERRFRALEAADGEVEVTVTGGIHRPPFVRGPHVEHLFARAAAVAERIGMPLVSDGLSGGGSDGNFTAAMGIATLDGLGVDGDGAHTHEEHLLVSSIEPGTRLMLGLMATLGA